MKHPDEISWSVGPGPDAAEARMRAARKTERPNYAAMTDALWADAWGPPHPDGRGPLAVALDHAAEHAAR